MKKELDALQTALDNLRAVSAGDSPDYDKVLEAWQEIHRKVYELQDSFWDLINWDARSRRLNPHLYTHKVGRGRTPTQTMTTEELDNLMKDLGL